MLREGIQPVGGCRCDRAGESAVGASERRHDEHALRQSIAYQMRHIRRANRYVAPSKLL